MPDYQRTLENPVSILQSGGTCINLAPGAGISNLTLLWVDRIDNGCGQRNQDGIVQADHSKG